MKQFIFTDIDVMNLEYIKKNSTDEDKILEILIIINEDEKETKSFEFENEIKKFSLQMDLNLKIRYIFNKTFNGICKAAFLDNSEIYVKTSYKKITTVFQIFSALFYAEKIKHCNIVEFLINNQDIRYFFEMIQLINSCPSCVSKKTIDKMLDMFENQ